MLRFCRAGVALVVVLVACVLGTAGQAADKIPVTKQDDLPRHTYTISVPAAEFVASTGALSTLAVEVKADLLDDLERYDIRDEATLSGFYRSLTMLSAITGDYEAARLYHEQAARHETKESQRLIDGLLDMTLVDAVTDSAGESGAAFAASLRRRVEDLPFEIVEARVREMIAGFEIRGHGIITGLAESRYQPTLDQSGGSIGMSGALALIGLGYQLNWLMPYREEIASVLGDYVATHAIERPDIWGARTVNLDPSAEAEPVVVAIWDVGVDVSLPALQGRLWVNENEVVDNGADDDKNGWVDDVHGIAWSLNLHKTSGMLFPIGDVEEHRPRLQRQAKGLSDLRSGIASEEASELRQTLSNLDQEATRRLLEELYLYNNHSHGTHVAGVAVEGNPFARVLVARWTPYYSLTPREPTVEMAERDAEATAETFAYLKEHQVRVVNMSWGHSVRIVEAALEANNVGETPEKRKALAREIFEITRNVLIEGIRNTPEILYIASAGNFDAEVDFYDYVPSGLDLPNLMSVGAVDQAGEETEFTSYGKVDVYANGFEVLSYVPGGDQMRQSGTSQSAPQVSNLAAKMLALRPELTPVQVRQLIIAGSEERQVGERTIRLLHPKRTMELLESQQLGTTDAVKSE